MTYVQNVFSLNLCLLFNVMKILIWYPKCGRQPTMSAAFLFSTLVIVIGGISDISLQNYFKEKHMTRLEILAAFDIMATSLLLIWGTAALISEARQRVRGRKELKAETAAAKKAKSQYIRALKWYNREMLWEEVRRDLL